MRKSTFCGELYSGEGRDMACLGCIHRADGGFVVREPDGTNGIGPIGYGGHVFDAVDFTFIRRMQISAARSVKMYRFADHLAG